LTPITVVVWDHVGNVLWGVRPWDEWTPHIQSRLLAEDPDAIAHAPSLAQIFQGYQLDLREVKTVGELAAVIAEADVLVVHKETVPPDVLRLGTRLRLIQHLGLDYRGIPVETASELGIPVAATPLVNYLAVAEHTWALILSSIKQLAGQRALMQGRGYHDSWGGYPNLRLARDMTLGLLGFGEIARPVARIAQAFEMRTIYWDITRFAQLEAQYGVEYVAWDELFRRADVVSVQLALNEQTHGCIGAREIGLMKPAALFVNTARGKLVDQAALVEALRAHRIGGAALDVFAEEPLPEDDPLHDLHEQQAYHVTLTPHSAWQSPWTWVRDSHGIWLNVIRLLRDEPIEYLVS
jgi:phosphoglycerate dehydrogenase-like enzyme